MLLEIKIVKDRKFQSALLESRAIKTTFGMVQVDTLRINPKAYNLRLAFPKNQSSGGSSLGRYKDDEQAFGAFTGGFLETHSPPTPAGLVVRGGKVYSNLYKHNSVMTAVVCFGSEGPIHIMRAAEFYDTIAKGDCIQTGPYLIRDKKAEDDLDALDKTLNFPFSGGALPRAFLSLNFQHEITIGVTGAVSLFALRDLLLTSEQMDGLGAKTAVGFSGTRTAGLIVGDGSDESAFGDVNHPLPNAVIIERRQP